MYKGINKNAGIVLDEQEALAYALSRCGIEAADKAAPEFEEFKEMFAGWYFSGDWEEENEAL